MIGYYVHHQGSGHRHRALTLALALSDGLGCEVTGLSSLERPHGWPGPWIRLERDDGDGDVLDPTAGGRLHWLPLGHPGLRARMSEISTWIRDDAPSVVVCDVSVEVTLLTRLHGIPVVSVVLPGHRVDPAHALGYDVSTALVGFWPPRANRMVSTSGEAMSRVQAIGGVSRFPVRDPGQRRPGPQRVAVLLGTGGEAPEQSVLAEARAQTPDWEWTVLHPTLGSWTDDPASEILDADVVVTHAGQNALAEVAGARRPAVVIPQPRPHREQVATGAVLSDGPWPALVVDDFASDAWGSRLARAAALDGRTWSDWVDGDAQRRFTEVVRHAIRGGP